MSAHASPCSPVVYDVPNGKGVSIGMASDLHAHLEGRHDEPRRLAEALSKTRRDILILLGDVYHAPAARGRSTAAAVVEVVQELAKKHEHVVFVPGNHDVRHANDPWHGYKKLEKTRHVLMPQGKDPVVKSIGGVRIMAANLFYDGSLLTPESVKKLGQDPADLHEFYQRDMEDGKALFLGQRDDFSAYKHAADRVLTHDREVDILATHVPPHASAVVIPAPSQTDAAVLEHFSRKGVQLLVDDDVNRAMAQHMAWFRDGGQNMHRFYRNVAFGAYWSGSNILGTCTSTPQAVEVDARYNLLALFGHTHQSIDHLATVGGRRVRFLSRPTRCQSVSPVQS